MRVVVMGATADKVDPTCSAAVCSQGLFMRPTADGYSDFNGSQLQSRINHVRVSS